MAHDGFSKESVEKHLRQIKPQIYFYNKTGSTNVVAKELAAAGAPRGTCVIAEEQDAGRGRLGRSFYSPPGCGVYLSVVIDPKDFNTELVTVAAAVAVCAAVQAVAGIAPQIKWVNDILVGDRKICGILAESVTEAGRVKGLVVGAGVNVTEPPCGMPEEIKHRAGTLSQFAEKTVSRSELAARMIENLVYYCCHGDRGEILRMYRQKSSVIGRRVRVYEKGVEYEATALEIDDGGRLVVARGEGETVTLSSAEVSIIAI